MTLLLLTMLAAAPKDCGTDLKCFRELAGDCKPVAMHKPFGPWGNVTLYGTLNLRVLGPAKNGCTFEIERKLAAAKLGADAAKLVPDGGTADVRKFEKQLVANDNAAPESLLRCLMPAAAMVQMLTSYDGFRGADSLGECLALKCPKRTLAKGCSLAACKDGVQQLTCGKGKDAPKCPVPRGTSLCTVSGCDNALATFDCSEALQSRPIDVLSEAGRRESACVLDAAYRGDLVTEKACAAPLEALLAEQASQPRSEEIDAVRIGVTATLVGARKLLEPDLAAGALWKATGEALAPDLADYEKYQPGLAKAVALTVELYSSEFMHGAEVAPKARALTVSHPDEEAGWLLAMGTSEMLNGEKGDPTTFALEVPKNASDRLQLAQLHMLVSQTARWGVPKVAKRAAAELDRLAPHLGDLEDELLKGDLAALEAIETGRPEIWREAQKRYLVASESPDDGIAARAFNNLGVVDIALGKPDAAKPLFEQAAERRPDEPAPRLNLSMRESVANKKVVSAGEPVEGGLFAAWVFRAQVLAAKGDREGAKTAAVWALERLKQRKWRDGEFIPELSGSFTVNLTPHRNGFSLDFHGVPTVWLVNRPAVTRAELEAMAK